MAKFWFKPRFKQMAQNHEKQGKKKGSHSRNYL